MLNLEYTSHKISITGDAFHMNLSAIQNNIIHCSWSKEELKDSASILLEQNVLKKGIPFNDIQEVKMDTDTSNVFASAGKITVEANLNNGQLTWREESSGRVLLEEGKKEFIKVPVIKYTTGDEQPVIERVKTVDGERNFIKNLRETTDHEAYQGRLYFQFKVDESIHGLGQGEDGIYDYRMHTQYLYQHNMRIPMPMFLSSEGYGMLFDAGCLMTFQDNEAASYMFFDAIPQLDYYVVFGENIDEIISGFRYLTGKAVMLPKWAFGYIQSKEQYYTADELASIVRHYREIKVPLDGVVQDWNTWEPGQWGQKSLDPKRYDNMEKRAEEIHSLGAHTMISVWPNMNTGTANHTEFTKKGYLLNDYATYDAFNEKAREMFWKQCKEGLFDRGFDSLWCDSTEPFSGPDWGGEIKREPWLRYSMVGKEHKKYLPAEKANLYALAHAKGVYENQRKDIKDMRVLNLTRSGYASGQKYGAVLWSGDITADWFVMKRQIAEGLNMAMSGYPYWTLDIGGFFAVGKEWQKRGCSCNTDPTPKWFWRGRFDEGIRDKGFCELYTRWIEFGCFLPMFRSHGTDTPREIWNFGNPGTPYYDAIEKYIKLRYRLMPYIYSLAGGVVRRNETIMRSLLFDFSADKKAASLSTEYMFGKNLLICPVFEPMYYEAENTKLEREKVWNVYLPEGCNWYDFETGKEYVGGRTIVAETPIDKMPIYVREGSILPEIAGLQYAMEKTDAPLELHVYPGKDAKFILYNDAGMDYAYEEGEFAETEVVWSEQEKKLTIKARKGKYKGMPEAYPVEVFIKNNKIWSGLYTGKTMEIRSK